MTSRILTLSVALLISTFLSGCGTDTKTTENPGGSVGQSHYGGLWIDGNDNPANRAQYLGYSLVGDVTVGAGTKNVDYTISCESCHAGGNTTVNSAILKKYATTGHADVTAIPWTVPETGTSCQRCHSTFGFLYHLENYDPDVAFTGITLSTTAGGQREGYRKAMQVLICSACHPEDGLATGTLRPAGQFDAIWSQNSITARVSFPDAGASNLCIRCHSARRAGPNITQLATTTAHYLPAAATIYSGTAALVKITGNTTTIVGTGTAEAPEVPAPAVAPFVDTEFTGVAYEFTGKNYLSPVLSHKNVGTPGNKGPCVGCHMGGATGHSLEIIEKDADGEITAINSDACLGCHGVMSTAWLNDKKAGFAAATAALDTLLQGKGFFINPENGTFYKDAAFSVALSADAVSLGLTTAQATAKYYDDQAAAFGLDKAALRGAAFNLWLFSYHGGDPAAYVHNSSYTKQVLFDTIDYLTVGDVALANPVAAAYLDGDDALDGIQRP